MSWQWENLNVHLLRMQTFSHMALTNQPRVSPMRLSADIDIHIFIPDVLHISNDD